jgi:transcriptional regulator with PAS, ATPase and Fis domain
MGEHHGFAADDAAGGHFGFAAEAAGSKLFHNSMHDNEKNLIITALKESKGNKTRAAKLLNIQRSVLYSKMERLGIQ